MDGDGDLDFVHCGLTSQAGAVTRIVENRGNDRFVNANIPLTGLARNASAEWGDFEGDGDLDLLIHGDNGDDGIFGGTGEVIVYRNDGPTSLFNRTPRFEKVSPADFTIGSGYTSTQWVDWDGDGDLDIHAMAGHPDLVFGGASNIFTYSGDQFERLFVEIVWHRLERPESAWADIDGDGDLDLVTTGLERVGWPNSSLQSRTTLFLNEGGGAFRKKNPSGLPGLSHHDVFQIPPPSLNPAALESNPTMLIDDFNGDSRPDLFLLGLTLPNQSGGLYINHLQSERPAPPDKQPAIITSIHRNAAGIPELEFTGTPGWQYRIEASGDLQTWVSVGRGTETSLGVFVYRDLRPKARKTYYRVN
ncbi:MAG: VCBS repeat-containing protein [Verrucomicrobiota bacterium]